MITIKTKEDIEKMREGGKILAEILKEMAREVRPGTPTFNLEELACRLMSDYKVDPAFLNVGGFPRVHCVSIDKEVVHGVPRRDRIFKPGEIVSLDMGITHKGFKTDSAITLPVLDGLDSATWAKQNPELSNLIEGTKEALRAGIEQAKIGNRLGKISNAIQKVAQKRNLGVIENLVGHGIGKKLHEEPQVPNFGSENEGPVLKEGMVLAIEPMLTTGGWRLVGSKTNGRPFVLETEDGSCAAHFEHTVAITRDGPMVLTE